MKMHKIKPMNGSAMHSDMPEIYPSFHLDESQLPDIKDWKVGEEYTIQLKIRQTAMREGQHGEMMGEFEMLEAGVVSKGEAKPKKEKDGEEEA